MPLEPGFPGYSLVHAFEGLTFTNPLAITSPAGETNRLFIVERGGLIHVITNLGAPSKTLFLDLRPNLNVSWVEYGLTGLAFHPGHQTNGYFYVMRTVGYSYNRIARFSLHPNNPDSGDPASEVVLLEQLDGSALHNGGDLHFGSDGYLYASLGDPGSALDQLFPNFQRLDGDFFGGIIRIDVDKRPGNLPPNPHPGVTTNYAIPADNPFIGATNYQGNLLNTETLRTEFYAVGLRNPWRFFIDPETDVIYCGDVGGGWYEEIDIIQKGENYGWPYMEANVVTHYILSAPAGFRSAKPLLLYPHDTQSACVIGGLVYRGANIPALRGDYLYGDYVSGHIWRSRYDGSTNATEPEVLTTEPGIVAFGSDPRNGDVLVANHEHGTIRRLVWLPAAESGIPATLDKTGAFKDLATLQPENGIVPYEINLSFWSDYASKRRWFYVPLEEQITWQPTNNWSFPTGSVWIKHFDLEMTNGIPESARRVETRFLVRNNSGVYGVTYRWDPDQTNATLVKSSGMDEDFQIMQGVTSKIQKWRYPSMYECVSCHSAQGGYALGFNTFQLNCPGSGEMNSQNQLRALAQAGYFTNSVDEPELLPRLARKEETDYPVQYRARSYLQANCAQCHQPGARSDWDARISKPLTEASLVDGRRIIEGSPETSHLYRRLTQPSEIMPFLGGKIPNPSAAELFGEWIASMPAYPWLSEDNGDPGLEGSSAIRTNTYSVSSSGGGYHSLSQPLEGSGQIVARLVQLRGVNPGKAGILFQSPEGYASLTVDGQNQLRFEVVNLSAKSTNGSATLPITVPVWLKCSAEDGIATAAYSQDGLSWQSAGQLARTFATNFSAGFVAIGNHPFKFTTGDFDNLTLAHSRVEAPSSNLTARLPIEVHVIPSIASTGAPIQQVQFFSGQVALAPPDALPPFDFSWTNAWVGVHNVKFKTTLSNGSSFFSPGLRVELTAPSTEVIFVEGETNQQGNWQGSYGAKGFVIPGYATNIGLRATLLLDTQPIKLWELPTTDKRALQIAPGMRVAAAWHSTTGLAFTVNVPDGHFYKLSLYFLDWDKAGRAQRLEIKDARTGASLETRTVSDFSAGIYHSIYIRSSVRIFITPLTGQDAVLSGLFLDQTESLPPRVALIKPANDLVLPVPQNMELAAEATDFDGQIAAVRWFANDVALGTTTNPPYSIGWSNLLAGTYIVRASAEDNDGNTNTSTPVHLTVNNLPGEAVFHSQISNNHGDWKSRFGKDGWSIAGDSSNFPPSLNALIVSGETTIWENPSEQTRALRKSANSERIASAWASTNVVRIEVQIRDAAKHLLSLYFLDWDNLSRTQRVSILQSQAVLDTREIANFAQGTYMRWIVRGNVTIEIAGSSPPVVSALFFDEPNPIPKTINTITLIRTDQPSAQLFWQAMPGLGYRLQYCTNLTEADWKDWQEDIFPPGAEATISLPLSPDRPQVFYRLFELP